MLSTKTKIIIAVAILAATFIAGRYSRPAKIVTQVKTVEVEKKTDTSNQTADTHKDETITTTENKDGTKTILDHIVEDAGSHTYTTGTDNINQTTESTKTVTNNSSSIHLAFLAGTTTSNIGLMNYGGYASKQVLGPFSLGVWGLSIGAGGLAIGVNF